MIPIPNMRDDEIETVWFALVERIHQSNEAQRSPEIKKLLGDSFEKTWIGVMRTATIRWRAERLARVARRMYRNSTWYLKPWQVIIDLAVAGAVLTLTVFDTRSRGRSCRCG